MNVLLTILKQEMVLDLENYKLLNQEMVNKIRKKIIIEIKQLLFCTNNIKMTLPVISIADILVNIEKISNIDQN